MPLFSWRELKRVYYHVSYHVFITNSTKFEVIASNFSSFVSYEVYNQRSEINESLAFLHFLGEKRLTKVDFVIVLGRVFHNVLFSAFCFLFIESLRLWRCLDSLFRWKQICNYHKERKQVVIGRLTQVM